MLWNLFTRAAAIRVRVAAHARCRIGAAGSERGEGPVSTAIMVALLAAAAVLVAGIITMVATNWANQIPDAP